MDKFFKGHTMFHTPAWKHPQIINLRLKYRQTFDESELLGMRNALSQISVVN